MTLPIYLKTPVSILARFYHKWLLLVFARCCGENGTFSFNQKTGKLDV